jgi:hypothetical protein
VSLTPAVAYNALVFTSVGLMNQTTALLLQHRKRKQKCQRDTRKVGTIPCLARNEASVAAEE